MKKFLNEFKTFISRGNVMDMAIGVVIATAFGNAGVSLQSVIQTQRDKKEHAEIVAITHCVPHANILTALDVLNALPVVSEVRNLIRVENDRG